ncbi:polysaccharide deacetylase family protein [Neolewinella lacunae]|uniref:Polysaccharide deacetylase family protein n=1 Tax=Neolewinella lacunae TaxID=1517758 RepID=A0A923PIR4_9BACT|nr:polysaccharide deacetylase family protein [Neolewinella lacunae]MBC6994830.1 polysaccharide deacetylase family protein [Neolewinella lacunae]MDN3634451.1 polysaccharide deacetylase family protein [Neolewinella lacunae]
MHNFRLTFLAPLFFLGTCVSAQQATPNLAERLGYPADTKLLIVHADDLGVTHATNTASLAALEKGSVSSASVMANCPWLPEVAEWARANPEHDLGMHLVLTSEWRLLRWGSVAPADQVASLLDSSGYLKPLCDLMAENADPEEVEREIRAQIERARSLGLEPTHLDSHMGCLVYYPQFFARYLKVAREYGVPAMVSRHEILEIGPEWAQMMTPEDLVIDHIYTAGTPDYALGLDNYYRGVLAKLDPGVSVLLIHTALDGAESAGMAGGVEGWGNRWRQQDFNFFTSEDFLNILRDEKISLITWRELAQRWAARK